MAINPYQPPGTEESFQKQPRPKPGPIVWLLVILMALYALARLTGLIGDNWFYWLTNP